MNYWCSVVSEHFEYHVTSIRIWACHVTECTEAKLSQNGYVPTVYPICARFLATTTKSFYLTDKLVILSPNKDVWCQNMRISRQYALKKNEIHPKLHNFNVHPIFYHFLHQISIIFGYNWCGYMFFTCYSMCF